MTTLVERLQSEAQLVVCPYDRRSPDYWTTPNDKPCKFCGGLPEGPDRCTGADLRIMLEAAAEITRLESQWRAATIANEQFENGDVAAEIDRLRHRTAVDEVNLANFRDEIIRLTQIVEDQAQALRQKKDEISRLQSELDANERNLWGG